SNSTIIIINNGTAEVYKTSESNKTENTLQSDENSNQQTDTETDLYKNILAICSSLLNADDKTQRDNLIESLSNLLNENGITENVTETETETENVTENVTETEEAATQSEEVDSATISQIQANVKEIITQQNEALESLYEDLANAQGAYERTSINAQISALNLEYEAELDYLVSNLYDIDDKEYVDEIVSQYSPTLKDLYNKLSNCDDIDEREALNAQIQALEQECNEKLNEIFQNYPYIAELYDYYNYNYNNNIETQKNAIESSIQKEIESLYESLSNVTDFYERKSIMAQIEVCSNTCTGEISELTMQLRGSSGNESYNQYISFEKQKASIEYSQSQELIQLYTDLINASSTELKTYLQETIKETEAKYNAIFAELTTSD
ncbi:MAG: hypothetical protein LUG16_06925, partial [Candidatus Gastranaerophilales bacterium]|nr:hypothetical protein [Candidatus Gastranaerophilales bacterium]